MAKPLAKFFRYVILAGLFFALASCWKETRPGKPPSPPPKVVLGDVPPSKAPQLGKPAPEIEGEDINGTPFKLTDYRGKVVLLDFWATWCSPCRELFPHERSLVNRYKTRPFVLLGVNIDDEPKLARKMAAKFNLNWRNWSDPPDQGSIARRWSVRGIPTIYLIDAQGVVRYYQVFNEELEDAVEELVKEAEQKT